MSYLHEYPHDEPDEGDDHRDLNCAADIPKEERPLRVSEDVIDYKSHYEINCEVLCSNISCESPSVHGEFECLVTLHNAGFASCHEVILDGRQFPLFSFGKLFPVRQLPMLREFCKRRMNAVESVRDVSEYEDYD